MLVVSSDGQTFGCFIENKRLAAPFESKAIRYRVDPEGTFLSFSVAEAYANDMELLIALGNTGLNLSQLAPFYKYYKPPLLEGVSKPMPHQLETAAFLTINPRAYVGSEMRTGKTGAVVMALDYLNTQVEPGVSLIICPATVMSGVWQRSIELTLGKSVGLLRGTPDNRCKLIGWPYEYLVINYEGISVAKVFDALAQKIDDGSIKYIVVDELDHAYGDANSNRSKDTQALTEGQKWLWGLSGTLGANSEAVFGCTKLINYDNMPWKSKTGWKSAVKYHYGAETWAWRDRPGAEDTIKEVLRPCIRFTREQTLPYLPDVTYTRRDAELSTEQKKHYQNLKQYLFSLLESGEAIQASHKASLISKLFQIASGSVITEDGASQLDCSPRLKLIKDTILESQAKSVVFVSFVETGTQLTDFLNRNGVSTAKVDGSVTGSKRDQIFQDFQHTDKYKVLVAHPITTAYGTELAAADQLILDGPLLSGTHTYMQGTSRLSSAKQTSNKITIIEISSVPEESIFFDSLRKREQRAKTIAKVFESIGGK
jgi:superfamily II DNA or RNA helicase